MPRVVVFLGGTRTSCADVQLAVAASRDQLAAMGVAVPATGSRTSRHHGLSHGGLQRPDAAVWLSLKQEIEQSNGDVALLIAPALLQTAPDDQPVLGDLLRSLGSDVALVAVVDEQLTVVNDRYRQLVAGWQVSKRLAQLASSMLRHSSLDLDATLRPWYTQRSLSFAAIPASELRGGNPLVPVLSAVGIEVPQELTATPMRPPPRLGRIGVEANRLLTGYLRASDPGFKPGRMQTMAASRSALVRAQQLGWCRDDFWGWTTRPAGEAVARFDAGNHRFARAVWGTDWTIPYPLERACSQTDILDLGVHVIDAIYEFVNDTADRVSNGEGGER